MSFFIKLDIIAKYKKICYTQPSYSGVAIGKSSTLKEDNMANKVSAANVDAVLKDLASVIDQMWGNEIGGIKASLGMGFLHWNSCFLINTRMVDASQLEYAKGALRKFGGYLVSPNPVGDGFELWIIPHLWKNPYE